jgi:hypothetical protein
MILDERQQRQQSCSTTRHKGAWVERSYSFYSFSTSALDEEEVLSVTSRPRFSAGASTPGTHCTGGWVGPTAGLDTEARGKIILRLPGSNLDLPNVQP